MMQDTARPAIAYHNEGALYLNLTNRCPTACRFCVKREWKWGFHGWDLRLAAGEPELEEVWKAVEAAGREGRFKEIVYCGYGECAYRLPVLRELGPLIRSNLPGVQLRLNTIGLGNLIWGRNIVPELRACLNAVSVSLNTADPSQWAQMHEPQAAFARGGFEGVVEFTRACARAGLETTVTAIDLPGVDLEAVRRLSLSLGARFRLRPPLS